MDKNQTRQFTHAYLKNHQTKGRNDEALGFFEDDSLNKMSHTLPATWSHHAADCQPTALVCCWCSLLEWLTKLFSHWTLLLVCFKQQLKTFFIWWIVTVSTTLANYRLRRDKFATGTQMYWLIWDQLWAENSRETDKNIDNIRLQPQGPLRKNESKIDR